MTDLELYIEALIFAAHQPVNIKEIKACLDASFPEPVEKEAIEAAIQRLTAKYQLGQYAFELVPIGEGWQFLTHTIYHKSVSILLNLKQNKRLSTAALETLAIIAYKQPITKAEIEQIRGVNCDYSVQKLLEKELIDIAGRSNAPGRPVLYRTSPFFMQYFGLFSVKDLPKLTDIQPPEGNEIGSTEG